MKIRRTLVAGFAAVACTLGLMVTGVPAATAATGPIFTVMNTSETLPDGVWFRNSPHTGDTSRITGLGVYKNEQVQLQCYAFGDAVGRYNNSLWYYVNNVTRPTNNGQPNVGFLNAHYINDGQNANVVDAGVPACVNSEPPVSPPPPSVTPCVFDMKWPKPHLTFSYAGNHRYYGNAWQAAKNWTDLGTGITITPAAPGTTGDIVFVDVYWSGRSDSHGRGKDTYASTILPDSWTQNVYKAIPRYFHTPQSYQYRCQPVQDG